MRTKEKSIRWIADRLRRSPSTISRELERNSVNGQYNPDYADDLAHARKCAAATGLDKEHRYYRRTLRYIHDDRCDIAWMSDVKFYLRGIFPKKFIPFYKRWRIVFRMPTAEKPNHYFKLIEMFKMLDEHKKNYKPKKPRFTRLERQIQRINRNTKKLKMSKSNQKDQTNFTIRKSQEAVA